MPVVYVRWSSFFASLLGTFIIQKTYFCINSGTTSEGKYSCLKFQPLPQLKFLCCILHHQNFIFWGGIIWVRRNQHIIKKIFNIQKKFSQYFYPYVTININSLFHTQPIDLLFFYPRQKFPSFELWRLGEIEFFLAHVEPHSRKISPRRKRRKTVAKIDERKKWLQRCVRSCVAGIICSTGPWSSRTFCRKTPKTTTRCSRPRRKVSRLAFYLFLRDSASYSSFVRAVRDPLACFRAKLFATRKHTSVTRTAAAASRLGWGKSPGTLAEFIPN